MLAVFEQIDLSLLETLLAGASGESSLQMVSFANQPPGKGHSVPDALFSARFAYWFEVKTARDAVDASQLSEHLSSLDDEGGEDRLFVITPDAQEPASLPPPLIRGRSGSVSGPCTTRLSLSPPTPPRPSRSGPGSSSGNFRRSWSTKGWSTTTTSLSTPRGSATSST